MRLFYPLAILAVIPVLVMSSCLKNDLKDQNRVIIEPPLEDPFPIKYAWLETEIKDGESGWEAIGQPDTLKLGMRDSIPADTNFGSYDYQRSSFWKKGAVNNGVVFVEKDKMTFTDKFFVETQSRDTAAIATFGIIGDSILELTQISPSSQLAVKFKKIPFKE